MSDMPASLLRDNTHCLTLEDHSVIGRQIHSQSIAILCVRPAKGVFVLSRRLGKRAAGSAIHSWLGSAGWPRGPVGKAQLNITMSTGGAVGAWSSLRCLGMTASWGYGTMKCQHWVARAEAGRKGSGERVGVLASLCYLSLWFCSSADLQSFCPHSVSVGWFSFETRQLSAPQETPHIYFTRHELKSHIFNKYIKPNFFKGVTVLSSHPLNI